MESVVRDIRPLGFPWETADPFLFCVHHDDKYPVGNEHLGPATSLSGRDIGQDFAGIDGWRMYHGAVVPGFPQHPHRGFETVTVVRRGFIDHSDSLGATARYGAGDTQWLTAGAGIVHAEMFPLLSATQPNPLELFQIWLNLPRADKLAQPHFSMFWSPDVPRITLTDERGRETRVSITAGALGDRAAPPPPPRSWAGRPDSHVAIWEIALQAGAHWQLPAADPSARRTLYFYAGSELQVAGTRVQPGHSIALKNGDSVELTNGDGTAELLLLQGRPIGEPVVQYGPFVMNTRAEIQQAVLDYQRTQFGGWPWDSDDPVHPRDAGRFAQHIGQPIERAKE
jgi:redox-sensitive bicupin YhaK (pirin superfamily)